MINIMNIALWKTRWFLKEKSSWFNMIILPVVFALIFGGMQSNDSNKTDYLLKVGIVADTTKVDYTLLKDVIGDYLNADIITFNNKEESIEALKANSVSALLLWEKNFENSWTKLKQTPWSFLYERETAENLMMQKQMQGLIIGLNALTMDQRLQGATPQEQVEIWLQKWKDYRDNSTDISIKYGKQEEANQGFSRIFIGFSLMFMMFALNQSAATILEEKETGTWTRLLTAPLNKVQLISGNIIHFLFLGLIQFIILMVFSRVVFNVNWGYYTDTIIFAVLIILTVSGLGFMLATMVKTKVQQNIYGSIIITVTSMVGGVYWPLDFVSGFMRRLADFVPQKWAMEGLLQLMSGGYRLADVTYQIEMLLLFLAVFYLVAFIRIRRI